MFRLHCRNELFLVLPLVDSLETQSMHHKKQFCLLFSEVVLYLLNKLRHWQPLRKQITEN